MSDLPDRLRAMSSEWCPEDPVHQLLLEATDVIEVLLRDAAHRIAAHPLVIDADNGMARFAMDEDIRKYEAVARKYERLVAVLRAAI